MCKLLWTESRPARRGLYWYLRAGCSRARLVLVSRGGDGKLYGTVLRKTRLYGGSNSVYSLGAMSGRWAGPLAGPPAIEGQR